MRQTRRRPGQKFNPLQQLAELFLEHEASNDLHVSTHAIDFEGYLHEYPSGQYISVTGYGEKHDHVFGYEISPLEIRSRIYQFLAGIEAEISAGLVFDLVEAIKWEMFKQDYRLLDRAVYLRTVKPPDPLGRKAVSRSC